MNVLPQDIETKKMKIRVIEFLIMAPLVGFAAACVYWANVPAPVKINYWHPLLVSGIVANRDAAMRREIKEIHAGGTAYVYEEYCHKEPGYHGRVKYTLTNGSSRTIKDIANIGQPGCFSRSFGAHIPNETDPGLYHLDVTLTYKMNWLTTRHVKFGPIKVKVLKSARRELLEKWEQQQIQNLLKK